MVSLSLLPAAVIAAVAFALICLTASESSYGTRGQSQIALGFLAGVLVFLVSFFLNLGIVALFNPQLSHFMEGAFWLWVVDGIVGAVAVVVCSASGNNARMAEFGGALLGLGPFLALLFLAAFIFPPNRIAVLGGGLGCDDPGKAQMMSLVNVKDNTKSGAPPNTDPNRLVQVAPDTAKELAGRYIPQDLGSWLKIDQEYFQKYHGEWIYVVSLKPKTIQGFYSQGGAIPGYIVVSAENATATPYFQRGKNIRYVPDFGIGVDHDLERFVYRNWQLDHPEYRLYDLRGMEIDETGKPYYIATLARAVVGDAGYKIEGLLLLDPSNGNRTQISLDEARSAKYSWIDHIYPESWVRDYFESYWQNFYNRSGCDYKGQAGQLNVDSLTYQITERPSTSGSQDTVVSGAAYVMTYTSPGNDKSVLGEIVFDPTTGEAARYALSGASQPAVHENVQLAVHRRGFGTLHPTQCQVQQMYGQGIWYCPVKQSNNTPAGMAFLPVSQSSNGDAVVYDQSLEVAQQELLEELASGTPSTSNGQGVQVKQANQQFSGTVLYVGHEYQDGSGWWLNFMVQGKNDTTGAPIPADAQFKVPANLADAFYLAPGDHVIVNADVVGTSIHYQARHVVDTKTPHS